MQEQASNEEKDDTFFHVPSFTNGRDLLYVQLSRESQTFVTDQDDQVMKLEKVKIDTLSMSVDLEDALFGTKNTELR